MECRHYHYDCPSCSEEAIRERCPAFRIEWEFKGESMPDPTETVSRLWYKDGTYMDVPTASASYYESDPEWDHTERLGLKEEVKDDGEA